MKDDNLGNSIQFQTAAKYFRGSRKALTIRSDRFARCPRAETAFGLDKADNATQTLALLQIGHDEGPLAAHASCIGIHLFQRGADIRGEVDLVDDKEVRARDAGPALRGDLVAGGDIDHIDR